MAALQEDECTIVAFVELVSGGRLSPQRAPLKLIACTAPLPYWIVVELSLCRLRNRLQLHSCHPPHFLSAPSVSLPVRHVPYYMSILSPFLRNGSRHGKRAMIPYVCLFRMPTF